MPPSSGAAVPISGFDGLDVAAASAALSENPLVGYIPHPKQAKAHAAKERIRGFYGANRVGKTTFGVVDDLIQLLPPELVPPHLLPYKKFGHRTPIRGRVLTPDQRHTQEAVVDKFRELCPPKALRGGAFDTAYNQQKGVLWFERGDRVDFMSFEQAPDKFGGVPCWFIHYDEEPSGPNSSRIRWQCRIRLTDYGGYEIFTMTPFASLGWVYRLLWQRRQEAGTFVIRAAMADNPAIDPAEIERHRAEMSDIEFKIAVLGMPVILEGLFYEEFSDDDHVRPAPMLNDVKDWDVICGIDPGLERTGVVWVGFDSENVGFVFDELYPSNQVPADIAPQITERNETWGIEPDYYVIDPQSRARSLIDYEQTQTEYQRLGINCIPGQNARGPGILQVKRRLQHEGIYVSKECHNLLWEISEYRRDPKSQDEFAAIKENDHLVDALRYVCQERPWVSLSTPPAGSYSDWQPGQAPPADWFEQRQPVASPPLGSMM